MSKDIYTLETKYPSLHPSWSEGTEVMLDKRDFKHYIPVNKDLKGRIPKDEVEGWPFYWKKLN